MDLSNIGIDYNLTVNKLFNVDDVITSLDYPDIKQAIENILKQNNIALNGKHAINLGNRRPMLLSFLADYFDNVISFDKSLPYCIFANSVMRELKKDNVAIINSLPYGLNKSKEHRIIDKTIDFGLCYLGLTFKDITEDLSPLSRIIKNDGYVLFVIPKFWFFREELSKDEKAFLSYAGKNEKIFLFAPSFEQILSESGFTIVSNKVIRIEKFSRYECSHISSFQKLAEAEKSNNKAILEVCNVPPDLELNLSFILLKKQKHKFDAHSIFS